MGLPRNFMYLFNYSWPKLKYYYCFFGGGVGPKFFMYYLVLGLPYRKFLNKNSTLPLISSAKIFILKSLTPTFIILDRIAVSQKVCMICNIHKNTAFI